MNETNKKKQAIIYFTSIILHYIRTLHQKFLYNQHIDYQLVNEAIIITSPTFCAY